MRQEHEYRIISPQMVERYKEMGRARQDANEYISDKTVAKDQPAWGLHADGVAGEAVAAEIHARLGATLDYSLHRRSVADDPHAAVDMTISGNDIDIKFAPMGGGHLIVPFYRGLYEPGVDCYGLCTGMGFPFWKTPKGCSYTIHFRGFISARKMLTPEHLNRGMGPGYWADQSELILTIPPKVVLAYGNQLTGSSSFAHDSASAAAR